VVHEVAGGEDAGHARARRLALRHDVAVVVELDDAAHDVRLRHVADGDERPDVLEPVRLVRLDVVELERRQAVIAAGHERVGHERREELDVLALARAVEHDRRRPELVAPVHDRDLVRELREEDRLLHRRVAAADDHRLGVLEERGVAGGAVGHAAAAELLLARDPQLAVLGAHGEHHRMRPVGVVADVHGVRLAVLARLDRRRVLGQEARAEALGLVAELLHHHRAHDPLGVARVVLDLGRLLQQPAPQVALDHERAQVGARGVQRRRVAGGPAAHDDHLLDVSHVGCCLRLSSSVTLLCIA
jgi:hypothetical protein